MPFQPSQTLFTFALGGNEPGMFFYFITLYYWATAAPKAFTNFTSYFESLKSNSTGLTTLVIYGIETCGSSLIIF